MPNPQESTLKIIPISVNQHYAMDIPGKTLTAHAGATQRPIHHFTVAAINDDNMYCQHLGSDQEIAITAFLIAAKRLSGVIRDNIDIVLLAVFSENGIKTSDYDIVAVVDLSEQVARATPLEATP